MCKQGSGYYFRGNLANLCVIFCCIAVWPFTEDYILPIMWIAFLFVAVRPRAKHNSYRVFHGFNLAIAETKICIPRFFVFFFFSLIWFQTQWNWCHERDLNPQALRQLILSQPSLPISPSWHENWKKFSLRFTELPWRFFYGVDAIRCVSRQWYDYFVSCIAHLLAPRIVLQDPAHSLNIEPGNRIDRMLFHLHLFFHFFAIISARFIFLLCMRLLFSLLFVFLLSCIIYSVCQLPRPQRLSSHSFDVESCPTSRVNYVHDCETGGTFHRLSLIDIHPQRVVLPTMSFVSLKKKTRVFCS